jgi:predicted Rossmann fold nucleotide-binding protein DprA/Smf involved in DNA uptake
LSSSSGERQKRVTTELAVERNRLVASLADEMLIVYAHPGSKTESLGGELLAAGKRVYTFDDNANEMLIQAGATPRRARVPRRQAVVRRGTITE